MADTNNKSILLQIKEELRESNSALQEEVVRNKETQQKLEKEFSILGKVYQSAIAAGDVNLQKALKADREKLSEEISSLGEDIQNKETQVQLNEEAFQQTNNQLKELRTPFEKMADSFSGMFGREEESTIQTDPDETPGWVEKILGQNKAYYDKSLELTSALGTKISELGSSLAEKLGNIPGADAAKGLFDGIKALATKVLVLVGAFTAFQGFLNGLEKASEWFGDDANFKELFASGIAGIAKAFGIVNEEEAKAIAETLAGVFQWLEDAFMWMLDGVKEFAVGVKDFIKKLGGIGEQFASGDILGGLSSLWDTITEDLIGNINGGAVAAFALLAPKLTLSIVTWGAKTFIPKIIAVLSGAFGPALASIGTAITGALSTIVAGVTTAFTALSTFITATLAPLAVAAAPFIAAAAAIALAIKGIYEGIMEGISIFDETGSVLEGLKAGISKLFGTITGFIPDLLKDIVSWAARKLGFEDAADTLDSFSFTDAITDAFRGVVNWFEKFPLMLKKGIYSLLNKIPGFRGDFDEDIAALNQQMAEKDAKAAETTRIIEEKRAAEADAERLEKEKEVEKLEKQKEVEKLEKQKEVEKLEKQKEVEKLDTSSTNVETQTITTINQVSIETKPIVDGLKRIEDAIARWMEAVDAEMVNSKGGGGVAVTNVDNKRTIQQSKTVVSTNLSHRNIGATRGMFGAPSMPLTNPNA